MDDLFKKFLYTSVGLVSLTAEKLQKAVDQLVSDEKITTEEGKKIVDDFMKNTESKKEEFEGQLKKVTERVVQSFSYATQQQVDELTKRVEALEAKHKATKTTKSSTKKEELSA